MLTGKSCAKMEGDTLQCERVALRTTNLYRMVENMEMLYIRTF